MSENPVIARFRTQSGYWTTHLYESVEQALRDTARRCGPVDEIVYVEVMGDE